MYYFFAERIWLCIRSKNGGKYCVITLKIILILQNVCKKTYGNGKKTSTVGCLCAFSNFKKWKKLTCWCQKQCVRKYCCCCWECARVSINICSASFATIFTFPRLLCVVFCVKILVWRRKVQLGHQLKSTDNPMRFCFDTWDHDRIEINADFVKKNLFRWSSFSSWWLCQQAK